VRTLCGKKRLVLIAATIALASASGIATSTALGQAAVFQLPCSVPALVSAINTANGAPGPVTLSLAGRCAYTLTSPDNAANGLPVITGDIIIAGNGATITRAPSAPAFRIFYVDGSGALALNKLTISGGRATDCPNPNAPVFKSCGGGIDNHGTLSVSQSSVINNSVTTSTGVGFEFDRGGGIENVGTATVSRTEVSGNTVSNTGSVVGSSAFGGGIGNGGGLLVVVQSELLSNAVSASTGVPGSPGSGGQARGSAIASIGQVTIDRSVIRNNSSTVPDSGVVSGAVVNAGGTMAVTATEITGNTASGPKGQVAGGGIDNFDDLTVTGSDVSGNTVSAPGVNGAFGDSSWGAAAGGIESRGSTTVSRTEIRGNTATGPGGQSFGGGLRNSPDGTLALTRSTVANNTASGTSASGGGISNGNPASGSVTLNTTAVFGNVPDNCSPPIGACT
jgi:hypothetical protein